jgi:undecaprenyl-diphosphatase
VTTWQALFIGALQGATELFPVSSLGHAVVVPALLHWYSVLDDSSFLPFLTLLHIGTATALLILFRREWAAIIGGFTRAAVRGRIERPDERLAMLLVAGTVPAGVIGVFLQTRLQSLFSAPRVAASLLVVNGAILFGAELLRRRDERRARVAGRPREEQERAFTDMSALSFPQAIGIGVAQSLALLPGISRSGITMAAGLTVGLRHQEAVRFAFLLATPIILAAGLLEIPQLVGTAAPIGAYLLATLLAAVTAYASARFLVRYFRSGRLDPYAAYCVALGAVGLALLR